MKPQVVLVTGSRRYARPDMVHCRLQAHPAGTILIHGGCRGADLLCAAWAKKWDWLVWEMEYFEDERGREARNASMVAVAAALSAAGHEVTCYAFPDRDSVGTWKCVRLMRAAGLTVVSANGVELTGDEQ